MAVDVHSEKLRDLVDENAEVEQIATGFTFTEGPIWMKDGEFLLFSDVPQNVIYRWKEGQGLKEFLKPSGYTGSTPRGGEPGSNGLTVDSQGRLVVDQHTGYNAITKPGKRDIALPSLECSAEVNDRGIECHSLAFVNGNGPGKPQWDL